VTVADYSPNLLDRGFAEENETVTILS